MCSDENSSKLILSGILVHLSSSSDIVFVNQMDMANKIESISLTLTLILSLNLKIRKWTIDIVALL